MSSHLVIQIFATLYHRTRTFLFVLYITQKNGKNTNQSPTAVPAHPGFTIRETTMNSTVNTYI